MDDFFAAVDDAVEEYNSDYKVDIERKKAEKERAEIAKKQANLAKLMKDLSVDKEKNC